MTQPMPKATAVSTQLESDPLWFKDAVIYEIPVRAFFDANGDGSGDFLGLIEKLDYVQDLGVTAVWLLPFYPSPLRDGGYDIADYVNVNPEYGSLDDFKRFLEEAHRRGIRVITELVINHTSADHPWFQRARRAPPGSRWRNFYVWSDSPEKYSDARIIFQDFETSNWTWDSVAKAYYWHRFYSHQPDLNFDNPEVQEALFEILDFWLEMGVDGLRLDAIPYLYEREGTNCENLPETHEFLRKLRGHIDERYRDRMLLAEANQWPEDAAAYFGDGDECHMNFHFPLMPRMFMAVQLESNFPILDILDQTPAIPENCQWAIFLRNHDELTLEMVTDEDRDFMYRMYAEDPRARINLGIRRRLAPLLKERRKIELMHALLFSMPGTPVLYYGDEIAMGDNIYLGDRDGVRTPMQWSADRNAGFSSTNPQRLYLPTIIDPEYHCEAVNVEAHQNNSFSLLWWMKRVIGLRKQHKVFGRGEFTFLRPQNNRVLAFFRHDEHDRVLVVANLSRFSQYVELDLSDWKGTVPIEMFGHTEFPRIGDHPYVLTLAPHSFYWLDFGRDSDVHEAERPIPRFSLERSWTELFEGPARSELERNLGKWMRARRWFRGKSRKRRTQRLVERIPLDDGSGESPPLALTLVEVEYVDHTSETYVVPLTLIEGDAARSLESAHPWAVIARVGFRQQEDGGEAILCDAAARPELGQKLVQLIARGGLAAGKSGELRGVGSRALAHVDLAGIEPRALSQEQTNTSMLFDQKAILKILRVLEPGPHPEEEMGRFLTERAQYDQVPSLLGTVRRLQAGESSMLAILQSFVPSDGDAWRLTVDMVRSSFDQVLETGADPARIPVPEGRLAGRVRAELPQAVHDLLGAFGPMAEQLGRRLGELHVALAHDTEDPAFAPEPFSLLHQRSTYQSARGLLGQTWEALEGQMNSLPEDVRDSARWAASRRRDIDARLKRIHAEKLDAVRIRCHGDLHLGQALYTGADFVIIDFEGEPTRPIAERRFKRSPIRDVAGMLRSLHYAAVSVLRDGTERPEDARALRPWAEAWTEWSSTAFLQAWLEATRGMNFVPARESNLEIMLDFFLLEKCVYEVGYELQNRPEWLDIPIDGLVRLLGPDDSSDRKGTP